MKERRLDIFGLCETRFKNNEQRRLQEDFKIIYSGTDDGRQGVAFILTPHIAEKVDSTCYMSQIIDRITVKFAEKKLSLLQIYAPQKG